MLVCIDINKPETKPSADLGLLNSAATPPTRRTTFTATLHQFSMRRLPMTWFCEMANAVIGEDGELMEYKQLIANHKTRAIWAHSYGNELGRLAQGMPGCNSGTNTIQFIHKNQVPRDRARDITYGLITTLVRPEKIDEPNRTRLVTGGDRVTPVMLEHQPPTYSLSSC
jgi:hypothetical protein